MALSSTFSDGDDGSHESSYRVVDSFAKLEIPGSGNPAAVVMVPSTKIQSKEEEEEDVVSWMKVVAKEFNLSETAFIWPTKAGMTDGINEFHIRFYTANGTEVDLCGHATLASAAVVFLSFMQHSTANTSVSEEVVFLAKNDILRARSCRSEGQGDDDYPQKKSLQIVMEFPKKSVQPIASSDDVQSIQGMLSTAFGWKMNMDTDVLFLGLEDDSADMLVHLTKDAFLKIPPTVNTAALTEWNRYNRGIIMCCDNKDDGSSDESVDFISRWFGPKVGIDEDPVTGSAHCTLAPYFASLKSKQEVRGEQKSSRGGIIDCVVHEDHVELIGTAKTVMSGTLYM